MFLKKKAFFTKTEGRTDLAHRLKFANAEFQCLEALLEAFKSGSSY